MLLLLLELCMLLFLGIYYLCAMVLVSVSLAISALVANLWNRSKRRSYGVPSCVRVVSTLTAVCLSVCRSVWAGWGYTCTSVRVATTTTTTLLRLQSSVYFPGSTQSSWSSAVFTLRRLPVRGRWSWSRVRSVHHKSGYGQPRIGKSSARWRQSHTRIQQSRGA